MRKIGHLKHSVRQIKKEDLEFYEKNRGTLSSLLPELHGWFDAFYGRGDLSFDPLVTPERHREERHHQEGVIEITEKLTKKYGGRFEKTIIQEARAHVISDMGYVPKKEEYKREYFWDKWEASYVAPHF